MDGTRALVGTTFGLIMGFIAQKFLFNNVGSGGTSTDTRTILIMIVISVVLYIIVIGLIDGCSWVGPFSGDIYFDVYDYNESIDYFQGMIVYMIFSFSALISFMSHFTDAGFLSIALSYLGLFICMVILAVATVNSAFNSIGTVLGTGLVMYFTLQWYYPRYVDAFEKHHLSLREVIYKPALHVLIAVVAIFIIRKIVDGIRAVA